MKIKVIKSKTKEIEIKEPMYLYFQDKDCIGEEFLKLWEGKALIVKTSMSGVITVELKENYFVREWEIDKGNQTTKEHFDENLEWVLKNINSFNKNKMCF